MFSIYSSGFNLIKNKFDYKGAIDNFAAFAEEVVIAVNKSTDGTLEALETYIRSKNYNHVVCVHCDISYDDPLMDGKIKDWALTNTTHDFKIGLDLDERIPLFQKYLWEIKSMQLLFQTEVDAFFIHSIDLWGNERNVQNDVNAIRKFKWYLHKGNVGLKRGVFKDALLPNGKVDITKSDTCELIYADGSLAKAVHLSGKGEPGAPFKFLELQPYVFHLGYLDFQNRDVRNKNFWQRHWQVESGKPTSNLLSVSQMQKIPTMPHGLKLWYEK